MMIFMNQLGKEERISLASARDFVRLLAPLAPHLAEEAWARLGGEAPVAKAGWPEYDESLLKSDEVKIGLLVNGKARGEALIHKTATQDAAMEAARADAKVAAHLEGKEIVKVIYVPGKILNVVVRG